MTQAPRNFVILFRAREGSSPIIDLLARHPGLNVPIFEQLDSYSLAGKVSGDDIGRLAALITPLQQLGVTVHALLYEDFVADQQSFLAMIHRAIGLAPAPPDPAAPHFHKVLTRNPIRQVENWPEVNARPELPDLLGQYRRLIHRDHACLRPSPEHDHHA